HEIRGTAALYLNLIDVKRNNRLLAKENAELRAKLGELTELKMENERLNRLLGFQQKAPMKLLAARVTGLDLLGDHATIRINRGEKEGLKKGMAVITLEGVVGYIFALEPHSSKILVLTDRYAVIDSIVQRSRARGIVEGKAIDRCRLKYLHRADDVKEGDLVVTSGLDNIFPKGFPIGVVVHVEKKNFGIDQKVDLQPVVDPSRLEEVFIVMHVNNEKIDDNHFVPAPVAQQAPPAENMLDVKPDKKGEDKDKLIAVNNANKPKATPAGDVKPQATPAPKPESKPEAKPEAKPEPAAVVKPPDAVPAAPATAGAQSEDGS
ncbi:MAG TPA: rod shape-determining protein MreC, partial [Bdellovibrionales bacterium]|nr:rod shape-determining protein MreC [Bdellovibrionales bacterium]